MKKAAVFMTGVLAVASLLVLMSSCKKECVCTETDSDGDTYTAFVFPDNYDVKNCKELSNKLNKQGGGDGYSYKCK